MGLWALLPGNGVEAGNDEVIFSAGPDDEQHGLLGTLSVASSRRTVGAALTGSRCGIGDALGRTVQAPRKLRAKSPPSSPGIDHRFHDRGQAPDSVSLLGISRLTTRLVHLEPSSRTPEPPSSIRAWLR